MSRRGNPNIVAAALAGVWILLFLFAPLFVMEFPVVSSYLSIGLQVNGCQAIQAYPVILLALLPGILMLVSALLWEKIVGMVLSGVSFVMLLVFLLTCGPSVCIQALLFIPIPSGVSGSSSLIHVIWGFGGILCLILCVGVFVAEFLLGDRYLSASQTQDHSKDFDW